MGDRVDRLETPISIKTMHNYKCCFLFADHSLQKTSLNYRYFDH